MTYETLTKPTHTRGKFMKRIGKTEYKYVHIVSYDEEMTYSAELPKYKYHENFADARIAALAIDKKLLENGKQPVNILHKKV